MASSRSKTSPSSSELHVWIRTESLATLYSARTTDIIIFLEKNKFTANSAYDLILRPDPGLRHFRADLVGEFLEVLGELADQFFGGFVVRRLVFPRVARGKHVFRNAFRGF